MEADAEKGRDTRNSKFENGHVFAKPRHVLHSKKNFLLTNACHLQKGINDE
jgi:hypothetical protein